MLLLLTIYVDNLTASDDIVWQFALCTFNLHDQPTKWQRVLKSNKLWKTFLHICLRFVQNENQDRNVFIYIFYSPELSKF